MQVGGAIGDASQCRQICESTRSLRSICLLPMYAFDLNCLQRHQDVVRAVSLAELVPGLVYSVSVVPYGVPRTVSLACSLALPVCQPGCSPTCLLWTWREQRSKAERASLVFSNLHADQSRHRAVQGATSHTSSRQLVEVPTSRSSRACVEPLEQGTAGRLPSNFRLAS
jgi:hypothetical protein